MNNSVSPSPIGQPKNPFNMKLVAMIVGAAILVGGGVFAAMYPWGTGKTENLVASQTPAQTLTPTPSTSVAADETAGWQTYRDEKYGFEFKYPKDKFASCSFDEANKGDYVNLFASKGIDSVKYCESIKNTDTIYDINVSVLKANGVVTKIGQQIYQYQSEQNRSPISKKEVSVGGLKLEEKSYAFTAQDGPAYSLKEYQEVAIDNGKITIRAQHLGANKEDAMLFDQILSTFKFTK